MNRFDKLAAEYYEYTQGKMRCVNRDEYSLSQSEKGKVLLLTNVVFPTIIVGSLVSWVYGIARLFK